MNAGVHTSSQSAQPEPFVGDEAVAAFLDIPKYRVLRLTRSGVIRAYPVSGMIRHKWKYLLSEVAEDIRGTRKPHQTTMLDGSPSSSAKGKKHAE